MPKQWSEEVLNDLEQITKLMAKRDAAIGRYERVIAEAQKHQDDADAFQAQIDALTDDLPREARPYAKKKAKRPKPWE